ncbi:uncharacterized protein LOC142638785 [Castanea sativa]|uniref:uncharacterized protein LOC142638785 n=1 Tax=Castanea sativa TaxID=21020 RepID=UPI003F64B244
MSSALSIISMENTHETQRPTPTTFLEMGHAGAVHEALPSFQTSKKKQLETTKHRRSTRRKRGQDMVMKSQDKEHLDRAVGVGGGGDEVIVCEDDDDEKAEVERKIEALQRIVPGGESLGVDNLFEETAGYIMALQYQVKALRALSTFFERLDKEKTKLGG